MGSPFAPNEVPAPVCAAALSGSLTESVRSWRSKDFYERCGFMENPYSHTHPPYHVGKHGHDLVIMSSPKMLTPNEYDVFFSFLENTVMKNAY